MTDIISFHFHNDKGFKHMKTLENIAVPAILIFVFIVSLLGDLDYQLAQQDREANIEPVGCVFSVNCKP